MSTSTATRITRFSIVVAIAITGAILLALLFATLWFGYSINGQSESQTPMQISNIAFVSNSVREIPEVQKFMQLYPNATVKEFYNNVIGAQYTFSSTIPAVRLDNETVQGVELDVYTDTNASQKDTQAGNERQIGSYFFKETFYCSPVNIKDAKQSWFQVDLWVKSRAQCPSERDALGSKFVQLGG